MGIARGAALFPTFLAKGSLGALAMAKVTLVQNIVMVHSLVVPRQKSTFLRRRYVHPFNPRSASHTSLEHWRPNNGGSIAICTMGCEYVRTLVVPVYLCSLSPSIMHTSGRIRQITCTLLTPRYLSSTPSLAARHKRPLLSCQKRIRTATKAAPGVSQLMVLSTNLGSTMPYVHVLFSGKISPDSCMVVSISLGYPMESWRGRY